MGLAKAGETIPSCDLVTVARGGRQIWLNVSHLTFPSPRRDGVTLVHIFRDVTQQKAKEQLVDQLSISLAGLPTSPLPDRASPRPGMRLTRRERQVLALLARGYATKAIADRLGISPSTVKNHIQNIFSKFGVHTRLEAVTVAARRQLL